IYKRADRAYHFYETETGAQTHMIKENKIRLFHKYTIEPSGGKVFVYERDRLVDIIATQSHSQSGVASVIAP
ncbi:MAG: hypothetical protein IJS90_09440, partial [Clostridia bacterium]|nr:hypothetical protein [Clostridia bacterium]